MTDKDNARRPGQYNGLSLSGKFHLRAKYPDGHVEERFGKNLVTNAGETLVAKLLDFNGSEVAPEWIAFGSGTDGAQKTDTELGTEIAGTRTAAISSVQNSNTIQLILQVTAATTYTIEEMGIFNAVTAGTMISRFLTQPLSVVSSTVIDITWTLTILGVD